MDNSSVLESRLLSGELACSPAGFRRAQQRGAAAALPAGKAGGGGGTFPTAAGPVHRPGDGPAAGGLRFLSSGRRAVCPGGIWLPFWPSMAFRPGSSGPAPTCTRWCRRCRLAWGSLVLSPVLMREELAAGTLREIPVEDFAEVREISAAVRPGPERLRTAGTVSGFLPGTIRPALSISFYQNKADKHRNPGSVRDFLYVVTKLKICRKVHQKSIAFRL